MGTRRRPHTSRVATPRADRFNFEFHVTLRNVKAYFFNDAVLKRLSRAERKWMVKMGAYIRADANQSMRRAPNNRHAPAGHAPYAHERPYLKKFNYFYYSPRSHSVVVGPVKLPRQGRPVPGILEHGGTTRGRWRNQRNPVTYRPRPFMKPALELNATPAKVALLKDSVRR